VRLIAAEDTRQTKKLLTHYKIAGGDKLTSFHEHSKTNQLDKILSALESGDVALVSDAGMPGINDPGFDLVRAALEAGHTVSPIPGPSAPVAALAASGLPSDSFLYLGYLPRKATQRRRAIQNVANLPYTLIFLETPHRLLAALEDLAAVLGERQIAVARELTKLHEEILRGTIVELVTHFENQTPRGEITLVIAGATEPQAAWPEARLRAEIEAHLSGGEKASQVARQLAVESDWPRRKVYNLVMELQDRKKNT
jgi:16S rRNA (cytidine1402-2'-O)-methyltransferase